MSISTVSSKGQIVIPAAVRADMEIEPGTRVAFVKTAQGWLLKPATRPVTDLKGLVKNKPAQPVSVEDMDMAIRRQAKRLFMSR